MAGFLRCCGLGAEERVGVSGDAMRSVAALLLVMRHVEAGGFG